jgi:hypothetical protein
MATFRRWAKTIDKSRLIFLDETHLRVGEAPRTTLVMPGEKPFVVVADNTNYAPRYDMIACCTGQEVLPSIIYSPTDRKGREVKGIRASMVNQYIDSILAQAVRTLDRYPMYLVCDRSNAHNAQQMKEAFIDRGCGEVVEIKFMPALGAKRLSPLDNGIFGYWKNKCRQHPLITSANIIHVMSSEWEKIPPSLLFSCYQHCALTCRRDVYSDCPLPHLHQHT